MGDIVLYHGSKEIIEHPEIRKAKYNKDFFYQPRDYIRECYLAGEVI